MRLEMIINAQEISQAIAKAKLLPITVPSMSLCSTRVYIVPVSAGTKQKNQYKKAFDAHGFRYMPHQQGFYIGYDNANGKTYALAQNIKAEIEKLGLSLMVDDYMD